LFNTVFKSLTSAAISEVQNEYGIDDVSINWRRPQDKSHGDISTAIALQLAKEVGKSPRDIAEKICTALGKDESVDRCEVAGAGYVNIWLKPNALISELINTEQSCSKTPKRDEDPIVIEYSGPNIAKPLGIHHVLSTVIGQAVSNLHTHLGYNVITVNHFGDWGTQFGKLSVAFDKWAEKELSDHSIDDLLALYVRFHEEAEKDSSLDDVAREAFCKLEKGEKEITDFWKTVVEISLKAINELYDRLHVEIEYPHSESMYQDLMEPILKEGLKKNVFVEGDKGAVVVEFEEETGLSTAVVQKGDSATIYLTRDLAQIRYRIDTWHPKEINYVVDVAQSLHFKQLFKTVEMLGWELPNLDHILFGRMRFKDVEMSTRKGNILRLEQVLNEAVDRAGEKIKTHGDSIKTDNSDDLAEMMGVGSVVYGVLSQNRKMDMMFDWDKFLSFEGNSAPYLQYTHARTCSILRKSETDNIHFPNLTDETLETKERVLVGTLLQFSSALQDACDSKMPHVLANYLYQLCQDYNAFYNDLPILKAEGAMRDVRLALTSLTASVLKAGAKILTIRVPERM